MLPGTGVLFAEQTVEGLVEAVERLERDGHDPGASRRSAERFSEQSFDEKIVEHVRALLRGDQADRC